MDGAIIFSLGIAVSSVVVFLVERILHYKSNLSDIMLYLAMLVIITIGVWVSMSVAEKIDPGWFTGEEACPNCEVLVDKESNYCPECGWQIQKICFNCGGEVNDDNFCSKCGEPVGSNAENG